MKKYKVLSEKWYLIFKYASAVALPALSKFVLNMGKVWEIPYSGQIAETLAYLGILLGALIVIDEVTAEKGGE